MSGALRKGDPVRFAPAYPRNHAVGSPAHVVGFERVGTVTGTGTVPSGPKAGVPYLDIAFPAAEGRIAMRVTAMDRARFEHAPSGRAAV